MVTAFGTDSEYQDATGNPFMSLSPDHPLATFSNAAVVASDAAAKLSADVTKGHRYLTPDYSTAQSPSVASEGFSSHFSDSRQSGRSIMSPDRDQGPSHMEAHMPGFYVPLETPVDMPHHLRQHLCNIVTRPHHSVPATAPQEPMMSMPYSDQGHSAHSIFGIPRTVKEACCGGGGKQGLFQEVLDDKTLFPADGAPRPFNADRSSHLFSSIPANHPPTLARHHQHQVAALSASTSSPASTSFPQGDASNCKSCTKMSAHKLTREPHEPACRALHCLFAFAGCDCRCKGKNEWKRHLKTQHLLSRLYTCPDCPKKNFNRKDLFTQHYIRMHASQKEKEAVKAKRALAEFDDLLRDKQAQADRGESRSPPEVPSCLFQGCDAVFSNDGTAWEKCLDHVSKHLEAMVAGKEAYRDYNFTPDQLAYFEAVGAITKDDHDCWVLGAQSNGERARENKKKIGKRPADADAVHCHTMNKRRKGKH